MTLGDPVGTDPTAHALSSDQLRVLASPLRETILGMLCRETLSAARIAERLAHPSRNLHYHLGRRRAVGLIELIEERPVRGATESHSRGRLQRWASGDLDGT